MTNERTTPVSVFELREVASGRIGYGDTKYHLHLLALAADEIERLSTAHEPSAERLQDRSYYDGARQAASMAHQSLKAMDEWINAGCGGRGPVVNREAEPK